MKHIIPRIISGEPACNQLEEDWLGPDPYPEPLYECDFCGHDFYADYIRDYVKDVDGSQGMICIRCQKLGVLDNHTPRGK